MAARGFGGVLMQQTLRLVCRSLASPAGTSQRLSAIQQALSATCAPAHGFFPAVPVLWRRDWSSAVEQLAADSSSETLEGLSISASAVERLHELQAESPEQPLLLRLVVEGGGCSGFTYNFGLDTSVGPSDKLFQQEGVTLVCDHLSYELVRGSTVDYTTNIIKSAFEVVSNPNASQSCGCGSSFAPKN